MEILTCVHSVLLCCGAVKLVAERPGGCVLGVIAYCSWVDKGTLGRKCCREKEDARCAFSMVSRIAEIGLQSVPPLQLTCLTIIIKPNEGLEPEKVDQEYHRMVNKPTEGLRNTLNNREVYNVGQFEPCHPAIY